MGSYEQEWLVLLVKWTHLIVGIAWIGASFYFNWLEGRLERGKPELAPGVAGDLWAVHGGGFYNVQKFEVAPSRLPETLHWFKWEAYFTFLTGAALLLLVFYLSPSLYLVNPGLVVSPALALAIAVGSIVVFWLIYDWLCRTPLVNHGLWFLAVLFALLVLDAFALSHLLSHKAAFIHVGAAIGTAMVANVFFKIIPSQKTLVQALQSGQEPPAEVGRQGFLRSLHNNYFTLPVLFIMVASHNPIAYGSTDSWLMLAAIAAAGILIRHFFNLRNRGRTNYLLPLAGIVLIVVAVVLNRPAATPAVAATGADSADFSAAHQILQDRCIACHSAHPSFAGMNASAAGLAFDSQAEIEGHAAAIYQQAVATQTMPLGNVTHMTEHERQVLGAWIHQYQAEGGK